MDDTLSRLAVQIENLPPLTMDSTLDAFAETIHLCVRFEILDCPGMSEADIAARACALALDASTLTDRLRLIVRDAVAAKVRRELRTHARPTENVRPVVEPILMGFARDLHWSSAAFASLAQDHAYWDAHLGACNELRCTIDGCPARSEAA